MISVYAYKELCCPITLRFLNEVALRASRFERSIKGNVEIIVVGDKKIRQINRDFRKKDKITDVLSFAWQEDSKVPSDTLGQIYICYPQIVRQAKEFKITIKEEFTRMLVHGLLHLVGYDHMQSSDEKKMFTLQEKIISNVLSK